MWSAALASDPSYTPKLELESEVGGKVWGGQDQAGGVWNKGSVKLGGQAQGGDILGPHSAPHPPPAACSPQHLCPYL